MVPAYAVLFSWCFLMVHYCYGGCLPCAVVTVCGECLRRMVVMVLALGALLLWCLLMVHYSYGTAEMVNGCAALLLWCLLVVRCTVLMISRVLYCAPCFSRLQCHEVHRRVLLHHVPSK
ncbi:hypothetical protein DUNSADRAFT_2045 [Dunaliella salina]|uniref:Mucin-associated surface protein (MASP) n=1 Tax=Dunaliella salina TaxID=3046 RepID=A0ABQ7GW84_DUNSA|nr:hypothetical protein DUNSADRAFT_2045 [Dunaliella salina]|eukprot:KAF5838876.1 hypothetical protein DUNSADRAFT_2045 [Dunaliella salina]